MAEICSCRQSAWASNSIGKPHCRVLAFFTGTRSGCHFRGIRGQLDSSHSPLKGLADAPQRRRAFHHLPRRIHSLARIRPRRLKVPSPLARPRNSREIPTPAPRHARKAARAPPGSRWQREFSRGMLLVYAHSLPALRFYALG